MNYAQVRHVAAELYVRALKLIPPDVTAAIRRAHDLETYPGAKQILATILQNVRVAEERNLMVCQDTGIPIYKVRIGANLAIDGVRVADAIREGVREACTGHPFRSSICHPLTRRNRPDGTGEHIPIIDFAFDAGLDALELRMMPKGSGSENMTWMKMLVPADGTNGVKRFVLECVLRAGGQGCTPSIVGVGVGGTAELCVKLAKEALFRPVGQPNPDPDIAAIERELLVAINKSGIGPMGLKGDTTALAVHIESADTHITMNPVAVNSQCWRSERASARIYPDGRVEYGY
ncbi:MAG: fumarate hydratase [Gemmatimonadetes bacterium]|nr:fumarate hydratase [Gemmatimonadota bacterium]